MADAALNPAAVEPVEKHKGDEGALARGFGSTPAFSAHLRSSWCSTSSIKRTILAASPGRS